MSRMHRQSMISTSLSHHCSLLLLILGGVFVSLRASAHGGVALSDDQCVMSLGDFSAHFAGYQPLTRQSEEFCEDMPDVANSIFVIDFIHKVLGAMWVDFRIVRDIHNVGLSATWKDIEAIEDLAAATVYYAEPQQYPSGSMRMDVTFNDAAVYIGVVTASDPATDKIHRTVFPFRIGANNFWSYLPYFLAVLALIEIIYLLTSGGFEKLRKANTRFQKPLGKPH